MEQSGFEWVEKGGDLSFETGRMSGTISQALEYDREEYTRAEASIVQQNFSIAQGNF